MSWNYSCPKCSAMLNPRENIVLTAAHGERRVLIGFHPQPGNYELYLPPGVSLAEGDKWDFYCPVCQASLTMEDNEGFCSLDLHRADSKKKIVFSRVAGERATFVFTQDGLEEHHGEQAEVHLEHWGKYKFIY